MNRPHARLDIRVIWFVFTACASALPASAGIAVSDPTTAEPRAVSPAIPVEQLLRSDGTLDLHGHRGSVSTAGWRMKTGASGAPLFERESGVAVIESPDLADGPVSASDSCNFWSALNTGVQQGTYTFVGALALDGAGNLYVGGSFTTAGGVSANNIARWNSTNWSALGAGMNKGVYALALDGGGNLYAGGNFTTADGVSANHIACWNGTSWSALGAGMNGIVSALALDAGGNLYAGGNFTTADGVSANNIALWKGTNWTVLGAGVDDAVRALALDGVGNLYVGGYFTTAGGVSASRIAQWNGTSWSALGAGVDNDVYALALDGGGNLYVGGGFLTAGGVSAGYIAKWNGSGWSALGEGMNAAVEALALDGGSNLYAGGYFTTAGSVSANRFALWTGTDWSAGAGMDAAVRALAQDGGSNLYAGGYFTTAAGNPYAKIAEYHHVVDYHRDADGDGCGDPAISIAACSPPAGYVANDTDCDDSNAAVYPGAVEVCNGLDDDCDGLVDELAVYRDADVDGYGDLAISITVGLDCSIPAGYVADSTDCDDTNAAVHPGAVELCNGLDDNCDGHTDDIAQVPGQVGWWKGEGNANDAMGSNHGTPRNGATFVGGKVGQCFGLDGINDYVESLGTASTFAFIQNTGVFTIEAWIGLDDPNAVREQTLTANIASPQEKGYLFGIVNSGGQHGLELALVRGAGGVIIDSRCSNGIITDGAWHHVATTGNGTNVTFYVDGTAYAGIGTMGAKSSGDATRAVDIGWNGSGSYFGGRLDELAIYDRELSASEIQAIYNSGAAGRCALVGVDEPRPSARTFEFAAPSPNPAARSTTIRFHLPAAARVRVDVFDLVGRRVSSPIGGQHLTAGEHRVDWDGRDASGQRVASGIYEVRITTGAAVGVRRIVMLK